MHCREFYQYFCGSSRSFGHRILNAGDNVTTDLITLNMRKFSFFPTALRFTTVIPVVSILVIAGCGCTSSIEQPSTEITEDEDTPSGEEEIPTPDGDETPTPDADGYTLVWSDEFDGSSLDAGKWRIEVNGNGGGNAELQYYDESGISLGKDPAKGNSALVITARRESCNGKSFVSGRLNTSGHFEFTYGRVEARIRLPETADGLWPAFWMLGADWQTNSWPRCGEIDIMECGNASGIADGTQDRYFNGACHWGYYKGTSYPNYARHSTNSYPIQDGEYHLFSLLWDSQSIKMYLDRDLHPESEPYFSMDIVDKTDDWGVGHYFHHDFFIVLNLAVGGYFTGILNPSGITALPKEGDSASMYVDYVRVYQKK